MWVAERDGYFKAENVSVDLVNFASAVERDAALQTGQLDGELNDLISAGLIDKEQTLVKVVRWDRFAAPLIYLTYPIPKIVLLPVVLLFLGLGEASKAFLIFLVLFFQVLVVVRDASHAVRPELLHSVRSLGAGRAQLLRYVYLPACLPAILTSLRVTSGTAVAVLFFVEAIATNAGLGYYILIEGWGRMDYAQMYAGVLAMSLLGVGLYLGLDVLERRLCAWVDVGR